MTMMRRKLKGQSFIMPPFEQPPRGGKVDDDNLPPSPESDNVYGYGRASPTISKQRKRTRSNKKRFVERSHSASSQDSSNNASVASTNGVVALKSCLRKQNSSSSLSRIREKQQDRQRRRATIGGTTRSKDKDHEDEEEESVNDVEEVKNLRRRRSITFAEQEAQVKEVKPVCNMVDDPETLWFQHDEFDRIKSKAVEIVYTMEHQNKYAAGDAAKKYCLRGLENFMTVHTKHRQARRLDALDSVLPVQHSFNEDDISNNYMQSCAYSVQEAKKRASKDAAEAEQYLQSARKHSSRRFSM